MGIRAVVALLFLLALPSCGGDEAEADAGAETTDAAGDATDAGPARPDAGPASSCQGSTCDSHREVCVVTSEGASCETCDADLHDCSGCAYVCESGSCEERAEENTIACADE